LKFFFHHQERIYVEDSVVFITVVTKNRYPYFENEIFCEFLVEEMNYCSKIKNFKMIAYKINPDHFHWLILPSSKFTYSQIMASLKRNFSRDIHDMIEKKSFIRNLSSYGSSHDHSPAAEDSNPYLWKTKNFKEHINKLDQLKDMYFKNYPEISPLSFFEWQKSFHYWLIRDQESLQNRVRYIQKQSEHHGLSENKYLYIDENYGEYDD